MLTILGAGISGLSAAYHAQQKGYEVAIYEKRERWGGLCDNFTIGNGFRFDYFVHLSFTKDEYVQRIFSESSDFITHKPISYNYYEGFWLKHPAQNNLFSLPSKVKVQIIKSFIKKKPVNSPLNYRDWLIAQFGEYFTNNFSELYTRKYWTISSDNLTTDWLGSRFSIPDIENILKGAFEEQKENFYYATEMRYPKKGGYKSFLTNTASKCNIILNRKAQLVDLKNKRIEFSDNSSIYFEKLCSSIPLPELISIIKDCPKNVEEAAESLAATSGQLVSIGFNNPEIAKYLWFYIYDEDILPSRVYSPSLKSTDNAPDNCSSLQFETYYSKYTSPRIVDNYLIEHVIEKGAKMKLFSLSDIDITDYREVKYANVIFDNKRKSALSIINQYLKDNDILTCGRFGEWDYFWSDQSFLSGKEITKSL